MSRTLSFLKLDLITIRPYLTWKNLLLLLAVGSFVTYSTQSSAVIVGIIMVYGVIYTSYPFAVGEQNGIDALYCTLPIRRENVVAGRYAFAVFISLCFGVAAVALAYVISFIARYPFDLAEVLATMAGSFMIFSIILSFQLPIFFWLGYTKAKMVTYIPLMGFPFVMLMVSKLGSGQWLAGLTAWITVHPVLTLAIGLGFTLLCLAVSCRVSIQLYRKRDL